MRIMNFDETIRVEQRRLTPKVFVVCNGAVKEFVLNRSAVFGRITGSGNPDIGVDMRYVSRRHGSFELVSGCFFYRDLSSTNGTWYANRKLEPNAPQQLKSGDVLRVYSPREPAKFTTLIFTMDYPDHYNWQAIPLTNANQIDIGRNPNSGLVLKGQGISRLHAVLFRHNGRWALADRNSRNGVYVNDIRLTNPIFLRPGDAIRINNIHFIYCIDRLLCQIPSGPRYTGDDSVSIEGRRDRNQHSTGAMSSDSLNIQIVERSVIVKGRKLTLLRDINMTINPGEMVLVLGGSGAGKTTFMNAVMGYEKANGRIMYGRTDVYADYASMKDKMGFVPQQDLLRGEDRVSDTLRDAARLRLGKGTTQAQRDARVAQVVNKMGLETLQNHLVNKLSGGQRKRLSIAVEYVADPVLFFLDEPDSGLDGGMATTLMTNLRTIADDGKIVIVISHAPDRTPDFFDKIMVLAKGSDECGHLAYFGPVRDAYGYFDTKSLEGIVKRINRKNEGGDGMADYFIQKFNGMRR